jgi:hypothetical protein
MAQPLRSEEAENECLFDFEYDASVNNEALIRDAIQFFGYAAKICSWHTIVAD